MTVLRPCPCCGSAATVEPHLIEAGHTMGDKTWAEWWTASVNCTSCSLQFIGGGNTELEAVEDALKGWNTRADDVAIAEMAQRIQSLELECAKLQEELRKAGNRGRLTAEQVRKAVMSADRWEKPMGNTGLTNTHLIIRDDGWHAIADELNATLGGGECELVYGENDDGVDGWYTHCGGWFAATRKDRRLVQPGFCQLCGGKAVER